MKLGTDFSNDFVYENSKKVSVNPFIVPSNKDKEIIEKRFV